MKTIDLVKKGPKGLISVLNAIIKALNGMKLTQGAGIYITPTADGWIISTQPPTTDDGTTASASADTTAGGSWVTVDVMDEACVRTSIQVWSKPV